MTCFMSSYPPITANENAICATPIVENIWLCAQFVRYSSVL